MRHPQKRILALLLALVLLLPVLPVAARADTITVGGRTYRDGLGQAADLAGAKAALTVAVKNRAPMADLTSFGLGTAQLAQVFDEVFFENPGLYYLEDGYSYTTRQTRADPGALVIGRVEPSYYGEFTRADDAVYEAAVQKALSVLRPSMTDFDKALALHDYLAGTCDYDDTLSHYSPYHALVNHTAVCQGYLLAYSDLLDRAGVVNYPAISLSQNHGWNTVRLDGAWYHVDVTWDQANELPADWVSHSNFLRSDRGIMSTGSLHRDWTAPAACTESKYETSFLTSLRAPVLYPPEGGAYFLFGGRLCRSDDLSSLQYRVVSEAGSGMVIDPQTGAYYSPRDARLVYCDGSIYYTDSASVYRYDLATGKTTLHGSCPAGSGFLYSLSVQGGDPPDAVLTAEVRSAPDGGLVSAYALRPALSAASAHRLVCPARGFRDVTASQWYHEAVDYALESGLMRGVSNTMFDPGGTTTRAMIVTILYRMEEDPIPGEPVFADVAPGSWYADAVNWAAASGVVTGLTPETFAPDKTITREQFAAILYRYARYKDLEAGHPADLARYADADRISAYALDALSWANGSGLITGRTGTALAPEGTATRAEAATIFLRFAALLDGAA